MADIGLGSEDQSVQFRVEQKQLYDESGLQATRLSEDYSGRLADKESSMHYVLHYVLLPLNESVDEHCGAGLQWFLSGLRLRRWAYQQF